MLLVVAEYVELHGRDCPQMPLAVDRLGEAAELACDALRVKYPATG